MSINNIQNRLKRTSKQDQTWIERAQYRKKNKAWLDISFAIAVKVMSALEANKGINISPKTQKELAEAMSCSPQYINKLLRGSENLQLETITKIEQILRISLIEIPEFQTTIRIQPEQYMHLKKGDEALVTDPTSLNYNELRKMAFWKKESGSFPKLVA